jgi:site-specific recombinase XerD
VADANEALLESWELSLHSKRPRTVALYRTEARRFAAWLAEAGKAGGDLAAVAKRDVEAWIGDMRERGLSAATIRNRWIVLRNLYGWATEEGEIPENPMARVKVDKPSPPPPAVVSEADLAALLKACEGAGFNERRDHAIVRTLVATGLRVSELVGLEVGDLDLRNRIAVVRDGKGGRQRVVKFDPATAAALDRYKRVRARHRCAAEPALWIGHRGPMSRKGIPELLARRAKAAGIGHVHPHQLRHTWADRWLAAGGSEGDLLVMGGWESADVMRRYGQARAVDRALAAYDAIDPMRKL